MIVRGLSDAEWRERLAGPGALIRTGPFTVRIASALPELAGPLRMLYGDYPLLSPDAGSSEILDFDIRVVPLKRVLPWRRVTCLVDGRGRFRPLPRSQALAMFEWAFNWCVFSTPNAWLILHSGVVERDGRALLLPGSPGSGKSTLSAGLALRGWRLLSDEVGLIRPGTRDVTPVPRPVGLKEASIDVIRAFDPEAVIGPSCTGTRKGTVAHLRPPGDAVSRADETAEASWIVFPEFVAGEGARLEPISRAEALLRAGREGFNYSLLGATGFETLADVVDGCECYTLQFGDLARAVAVLDEATRSAPARTARAAEADR